MTRTPAVAGRFYPGTARELERVVRLYTRDAGEKIRAKGVVVPHAGYVYSGGVAGGRFLPVQGAPRAAPLRPRHTGAGARGRLVAAARGGLSLPDCRALGEAVAGVAGEDALPPLLIASSDMSHYEPDDVARKKDGLAIDTLVALAPEGVFRILRCEALS